MTTMRFGQVQRLRGLAREQGTIADLYIRLFGTTSLFALNCYWLLRRTLRELSPRPARVLDAGCGKGDFTFAVAGALPGAEVTGVDCSAAKSDEFDRYVDNIDVCNELNGRIGLPNVRFAKRDLLALEDEDAYDFVFCIHVLEHIPDNARVVANLARALKPGGHLYVQMPSRSDLTIRWLDRALENRHRWESVEHVACLTRGELESRVRAAGLEVVRSRSELGYLLTLAWQGREALIGNRRFLPAALTLPWLKAGLWLHRHAFDGAPGPYRRASLALAGAPEDTEGNLELLARKPAPTEA